MFHRSVCRLALPAIIATSLFVAPAQAQTDFNAAVALANQEITPGQMRDYLTFIASDELEGRDTPSRGLNTAAKFIASHLSRWGLKPMGGDGTYFQKITLSRTTLDPAKSSVSLGGTALKATEDFVPVIQGGSAKASGRLVYVGHGFYVKSLGVDAYKGVDVKGKIVVINLSQPKEMQGKRFDTLGKRGEDFMFPAEYAAKQGAIGIIYVTPYEGADEWQSFVAGATRGGRGFQPSAPATNALPIIALSPTQITKLFEGESKTAAQIRTETRARTFDGPFELAAAKTLDFNIVVDREEVITQNVVAVVEGSDPKLKSEYVAVGAHYDHVGMRTSGDGDRIFNGADDDGSGTTALMALAETFAKAKVKPKRSIIFVWHCGEEKGLWGSEYFTSHPTVPIKQIVAQVNIDMIGRSKAPGDTNPRNASLTGPKAIYVIGSTMMSSELAPLTKSVNDRYLKVDYDFRYDAPDDPNRFFYRSDHFNYAKNGIPVLFFFDGEHVDYHRPSDEVDKIDFDKMTLVARTVFVTTAEIANRPTRMPVDKPFDR